MKKLLFIITFGLIGSFAVQHHFVAHAMNRNAEEIRTNYTLEFDNVDDFISAVLAEMDNNEIDANNFRTMLNNNRHLIDVEDTDGFTLRQNLELEESSYSQALEILAQFEPQESQRLTRERIREIEEEIEKAESFDYDPGNTPYQSKDRPPFTFRN